ncbi:GNAT family N-acetyltransferase [Nocardia donostiensis]|uniref:Lysine N-acyltransferase MbtK n=1 Tax=Nocardia donostiensis TaxID=1538463 RepID=A0A1W0B8M5_9NOCA|nr:GNAT family N-acetyltransferase [Nocardia donostiensis]ONM50482.1 acetyltransferase [Nocardia donostiensis]OQS18862.1 acetyltransferase [Nocardia donostiensis]
MNETGSYVLARELTDLPDDVRQAPAPVIPEFSSPYTLRLADPDGDDPDMLAEWMSRPHLAETWEQAWPAERRRADLRAQLAGAYSRPCILGFDLAAIDRSDLGRREVAYVELYRPAKDEIARVYQADPHDMGFHIATADTNLLGRGVISGWLGELMRAIFAADPRCKRIMADPDHRNTPIRRALVKNNFHSLGVLDVRPDRRINLFALPRRPEDLPAVVA